MSAERTPGPHRSQARGNGTVWFRMNVGRKDNADPRWLVPSCAGVVMSRRTRPAGSTSRIDRPGLRSLGMPPNASRLQSGDQTKTTRRFGSRPWSQPVSRRSSSALRFLPRADRASGSSHRRVQCHGGANERLQRHFINPVALMEIDGTPGVAFEAGVEKA